MSPLTAKVMARVQKVAALAAAAGTEGEAQAAALMLQKLLAKHGLTMAEVEATGKKARKDTRTVEKERVASYKRRPFWCNRLAGIVERNFRVVAYFTIYGGIGTDLKFIGLDDDVQLASAAYTMIAEALQRLAYDYTEARRVRVRKEEGRNVDVSEGITARNAYIGGFLDGLETAFEEQVADSTFAIVLVRDPRVDLAVTELGLKAGSGSHAYTQYLDSDARTDGKRDGKAFGKGNSLKGK